MAEEAAKARLYVLAGPDLARSFALGQRAVLGRSDECDVVLRDRSISRKHARIVYESERWFVEDQGSTNGVTKDGQRGQRFELADGDEFRLGDLPLRFKLEAVVEGADIEFDLSPRPAAAPPAASGAPAAGAPLARAAEPAPVIDSGPEVELEPEVEEIEIEGADLPGSAVPRSAVAATVFTPRAERERRTGFFASDIEQQPFWLRCLIFVGLLAICGLLAYGAFAAVRMLRAGT